MDNTVGEILYRVELHIAIQSNIYTLKKGYYQDTYEISEPTIGLYVKDFPCSPDQTIDEIIQNVVAYILKTNVDQQSKP